LLKNRRQFIVRFLDAPRLEFFVRSAHRGSGQEWSRWFDPYANLHQRRMPSSRFVQWKAVIHDGRAGDGVSWVQPRLSSPQRRADNDGSRYKIRECARKPTSLFRRPASQRKFAPAAKFQSYRRRRYAEFFPVRFEQPPQGFRDKGYQSVLLERARRKTDDELRFSVYFRGETRNGLEAFEGKARAEIFIPGTAPQCPTAPIT